MSFDTTITTPSVAPPWLLAPNGKALLRSMGQALDQLVVKFDNAAQAHMPTRCDPSALPLIGDDRLMPQGVIESTANYRVRLQQSLSVWKRLAGTPWGVTRAALNVLTPQGPRIEHVTNTGAWDTFEQGSDITQPPWHTLIPGSMTWDGTGFVDPTPSGIVPWWRFWLVIYATGVPWAYASGLWGSSGKMWGDPSKVWGFQSESTSVSLTAAGTPIVLTVTSTSKFLTNQWVTVAGTPDPNANGNWQITVIDGTHLSLNGSSSATTSFGPGTVSGGNLAVFSQIQQAVRLWKAQHAWCRWIVVSFDDTLFTPNIPTADGTYGRWSTIVNGQYVKARNNVCRYIDCPIDGLP